MIPKTLKDKKIILASKSIRREQLLKSLGLKFVIQANKIEENYPKSLNINKVAEYLAEKKSTAFKLKKNQLLITADTTVILENKILNKPIDEKMAIKMLKKISNKTHKVSTGVCLRSQTDKIVFSESTYVSFNKLSLEMINYYIAKYKPFDKAGSYGIQEWIGFVGIKKIQGCYYNVMGLPLSSLYQKLLDL